LNAHRSPPERPSSNIGTGKAGAFVRCGVTGKPIPLEELHYWSVDRQEAYSGPAARLQRLKAEEKNRDG